MLIAASARKRPLIRETEQFPAIILGRAGRKKTTGQKSYRETDSFATHSQCCLAGAEV